MIWKPIITVVYKFLSYILDSIFIELVLPDELFNAFNLLFGYLGYFFPIAQLMPILRISIALSLIRITIAIIRFVKSFIPTMGG